MTDATAIVSRYIASWNEADADRRAALVAETFTESATYADPMMKSESHAGLAAMIGAAQAQFPGLRFTPAGRIDHHEDRIRFSWHLGPAGGDPVAGGTDFGLIEDGRLKSVVGFLDFAPQP